MVLLKYHILPPCSVSKSFYTRRTSQTVICFLLLSKAYFCKVTGLDVFVLCWMHDLVLAVRKCKHVYNVQQPWAPNLTWINASITHCVHGQHKQNYLSAILAQHTAPKDLVLYSPGFSLTNYISWL